VGEAIEDDGSLDPGGDGSGKGGNTDGGSKGPVTFSQLQSKVFVGSCTNTYCHAGAPPPAAPMSLEGAGAYAALVNTAASQAPSLMRVKPGKPNESYLVLKLKGQAGSVGGTPTSMPLNQPALDPAVIADVEAWILRGAPND
jgi:predicted CxxxxCH...CXXCH cytochrome family protein